MIIAVIVTILVIAIALAYTNQNTKNIPDKINFNSDNRIQDNNNVNIIDMTTTSMPNWKRGKLFLLIQSHPVYT